LADTWSKHYTPGPKGASLLDAAVVYAAFTTAGRLIDDMPDVAIAMLRLGPREPDPRIIKRASHRLSEMFEEFWDDRDFLIIDDWQDWPPERAQFVKDRLRLPDEVLEPMFEALGRWKVAPDIAQRLEGLMTETEIQMALPLLTASDRPPMRSSEDVTENDDNALVIGFEDRYHDLLVGPCDSTTAEAEEQCPLVCGVSVGSENDFDCSYEEWKNALREDVWKAADEDAARPPQPSIIAENDTEAKERIRQALTTGLEDGTRIEQHGGGWVVVDKFETYLTDPDDASWVVDPDDDDEEIQPAVFANPEAAYLALERSNEIGQARATRREEALRRLGAS
jgi:hypothetical protein